MTTKQQVRIGSHRVEISQPFDDRPDVLLIETDDGRRAILGDRAPEPGPTAHFPPEPRELRYA